MLYYNIIGFTTKLHQADQVHNTNAVNEGESSVRQITIDAMATYFGFRGKTAVISGAGSGIGEGIAILFGQLGANVVLCGRREDKIQSVTQRIVEEGGSAIAVRCDIGVLDDVRNLVMKTIEAFGDIDFLVNNAAAFGGTRTFDKMTYEEWDRVVHVNLTGTYYMTNECLPYMTRKKKGKIVMISSTSALGKDFADPHYAASKYGMLSLAYELASELMPYRINVNSLVVGSTQTEMLTYGGRTLEDELKGHRWHRIGTPYDQAAAAAFLCSEAADYITGHVICTSGGNPMY